MDRDPKRGELRYYRVYAKNSHGYGSVSTSESATTHALEVPGEVMRVTGSSGSPTMITVNWSAPNDGGSDILGYCIFAVNTVDDTDAGTSDGVTDGNCRTQFLLNGPGTRDASLDPGEAATVDGDVIRILPATSYSHTELSAQEEWSYQVYAFNRFGHSETTSGERTVKTKAANEPTAPEDLFVLQDVSTSGGPVILLYWNAPDDGGQGITSYRVEVTSKRNSWPETLTALDAEGGTNPNFMALDGAGMKSATNELSEHLTDTSVRVGVITLMVNTQTAVVPYQVQHTVPFLADFTEGGDTLYYRVRTVTGSGATEKTSPYSGIESIKITDDDTRRHSPRDPVRSSHPRAGVGCRCR